MKKSFGDYRLLAKGNRLAGSLWQGPDHLLEIEAAGFIVCFTETYRRIDYKNIQAISYARTRQGMWISIVLAVMLGLLVLGIVTTLGDNPGVSVTFGVCAAVLLTALIVHVVRGPTCTCKVQTAVQCRRLKPLDRMRKAERFVRQISQLCIAHQGGQPSAAGLGVEGALGAPGAASEGVLAFKEPWTGSKVVTWGLVLLVLSGVVTMADVFIKGMLFLTLDFLLAVGAFVLVVAGLTRSTKIALPGTLKTSLWGATANFILGLATGYGLLIWASMEATTKAIGGGRAPRFGGNPNEEAFRFLAKLGPEDLGWLFWLLLGLGAAATFFGLLGLPSALRPTATASVPVPPPVPGIPPPGPASEVQQ